MGAVHSADYLIIGAGAAGLSLARELSEYARVIVLEREESPGYHATSRSAAIFVDSYGDGVIQQLSAASRPLLETPPFAVDQALRRTAGLWTVRAGVATLSAPVIVNAAGAWASDVGVTLGARRLPLTPFRRTAATIAAPAGVDVSSWPMAVDLEESVYFKPDAGVLMLSPADETPVAAHDAFADDIDVAIAVDRFETLTDHPVHRVLSTWAGLRTMAPDRRPVIGFDAGVEGLFWLAGQGGFGIQTALGAAAFGRELIAGETGALTQSLADIASLISPARFSALDAAT